MDIKECIRLIRSAEDAVYKNRSFEDWADEEHISSNDAELCFSFAEEIVRTKKSKDFISMLP